MNTFMIMDKGKLEDFLKSLGRDYEVVVPAIENGNLLFIEDTSKVVADFKGRPRISPKEYLFPQREKILSFDTSDKVNVAVKSHANETKRVIWGVRPCDLQGIKTLDAIFLTTYVDNYYEARRKNTILIGLNCNEPCETGFCASCGAGPFASDAFDLLFTDLGDRYLIDIGTKTGQELVDQNATLFSAASAGDKAKADELEKKCKQTFKRSVNPEEVRRKLPASSGDALWVKESENCMLCGGCNFICPTCYCFNIEDVARGEQTSERVRYWDSCQLGGFTQIAAENTRRDQSERLRQRLFHKYVYIPGKYNGILGCTGCGRCIEVCPGELDITEVLGRVTSK